MNSNRMYMEILRLNNFLSEWESEYGRDLLILAADDSWWAGIAARKKNSIDWALYGSFGSRSNFEMEAGSHFHFVAYPCADLISLAGSEYDGLRDFLLSWHTRIQDPEWRL